jgi:hypothetical protein
VSKQFDLACGALGGFSGFLCEGYRAHDFLLGRRNCQQFLREHFCLPVQNEPVFGVLNPALRQPGSGWIAPGSPASLPLIPLFGTAAQDQPLPAWPKGAFAPDSLASLETKRIDGVLDNVLRNSVKLNWFFRFAAKLGLWKIRAIAVKKTIEIMTSSLAERGLV